jgi:hypothetical protein
MPAREAGKVKLLTRLSKLEDVNEAGTPNLGSPLVDQNRKFVRYEIRVNRLEYDFVRDRKLYLRKNLPRPETPPPLEFPDHSVTVKAAWRELPDDPEVQRRFYHLPAKILDWRPDGTPVVLDRVVGLVGLHIVHKTPKRKNWVWSTFEHVDNTERSPGGLHPSFCSADAGASFDTAGTNVAPPTVESGKPLPANPEPVQVARKTPVPQSTAQTNDAYHNHPQVRDTVWRYYRLVANQWPLRPGDAAPPGPHFPAGPVANVTLETYHQTSSCIGCHGGTSYVRFAYFPELRAADDPNGPPDGTAAASARVRAILEKHADRK